MFKKFVSTLVVSIFFACFFSCKKDTAPVETVYTNGSYNQSVKDYGVFKVGTYWVYQDSISNELDSVWVYNYSETVDTANKGTNNPKICPVYLYKTFSSKFKTNNFFEYNTAFEYAVTPIDQVLQSVIDSANGYLGENIFLRKVKDAFVLNQDMSFYLTYDILNLYSIQNNYVLKNGTVKNGVLKFHHTQDWTSNYVINYQPHPNKTYQYLAPNIGLVRKEIIDSSKVWNLIRYHIIQ